MMLSTNYLIIHLWVTGYWHSSPSISGILECRTNWCLLVLLAKCASLLEESFMRVITVRDQWSSIASFSLLTIEVNHVLTDYFRNGASVACNSSHVRHVGVLRLRWLIAQICTDLYN